MVASREQRGRDHEQRRSGSGGDDHIVGRERGGVASDQLAQSRHAAMVAVLQEEPGDVAVDPVVGEPHVGERAL